MTILEHSPAMDTVNHMRTRLWKGSMPFTIIGMIGAITSLAAIGAPQASAMCYEITDLGTVTGAVEISVRDVNSSGQVVGWVYTDTYNAFVNNNGVMTNLGSLGGGAAVADSINDFGQVVGSSATADGLEHAFLYTDGAMFDLGTLGGSFSAATAINDSGQIAGYSETANGECHAFIFEDGVMADLGAIGSTACEVWDINDSGQVIGVVETGTLELHAFVWSSSATGIVDLGDLGGEESYPYSLNNDGQIVGAVWTGGYDDEDLPITHAFLYDRGNTTDLGTLGGPSSVALGINESGVVVGASDDFSGQPMAFVYDDTNGMEDLNDQIAPDSGWDLESASSINDDGQIAGTGYVDGEQRIFLLTPDNTDSDGNGIPDACEEGSIIIPIDCGAGAVSLAPLMAVGLALLRFLPVGPARRRP